MALKSDLLTGEKFTPKRRNQKFASAKNRIAFNNNKAFELRDSKAFVDKPLKENHRILINLLKPKETKSFSKEFLKGKGYNTSVFSHYESYDNKSCHAVYQFVLIDFTSSNPNLKIHRKS